MHKINRIKRVVKAQDGININWDLLANTLGGILGAGEYMPKKKQNKQESAEQQTSTTTPPAQSDSVLPDQEEPSIEDQINSLENQLKILKNKLVSQNEGTTPQSETPSAKMEDRFRNIRKEVL